MGIIAEQWVVSERVHLDVQRATGLRRLSGLIARPAPAAGSAMRFARCRSVHGIGMRHALDVVFVGAGGVVTSVRRLEPWRVVADHRAIDAFELRADEAARLGIGAGATFNKQSTGG